MAERVSARLSASEGRKFALTVAAALVVLASVALWRGHGRPAGILGLAGLLLATAGIIVPYRLGPLYRAWMGLAHTIARVTNPVVMGFVYFVVITPVGIVMRLFGSNPLKRISEEGSFWIRRRGEEIRHGNMTNQF